ncbi:MAG: sigma-70 family RNA polymerase sigma factor [Saprospiraceae bacterium]|jgi:RNA polymerase sigma factor (sigma-70 family)|nr:sigma-70 family RNA polymerase sigma factor [Saprospiraceae bacterium]MDP4821095.1 sigma-70 family RNA polymerase sigma factor [Saprospiraceae bacterium]MDP4998417.1 sigma-70 family RNA polymerase sigma factor [Saprospiraceae bacterium]
MKKSHDRAILEDLRSPARQNNDRAFAEIYACHYASVQKFITKQGGTDEDAQDVFQEILIILYEKIRQADFKLDCKLSTYMLAICKNIWHKKLKRLRLQQNIIQENHKQSLLVEEEAPADYAIISDEKRLMELLSHLSPDCREILRLYYFDRLSMRQIAEVMGYNSEQVAKNKKSRCMQVLRRLVDKDPNKTSFFPKEDYEV